MHSKSPLEQFEEKSFLETFFGLFWSLSETIWAFPRYIFYGVIKTAFYAPRGTLWREKLSWIIFIFSVLLGHWVEHFRVFVHNLLRSVVRTVVYLSKRTIQGENFLRNFLFTFGRWSKKFGFLSQTFRQCSQNCSPHIHKILWKKIFLEKKSAIIFGHWAEIHKLYVKKNFRRDWENCILTVQMNILRRIFLKSLFYYSFQALSDKPLAVCQWILDRVVQTAFQVSRRTLWNK